MSRITEIAPVKVLRLTSWHHSPPQTYKPFSWNGFLFYNLNNKHETYHQIWNHYKTHEEVHHVKMSPKQNWKVRDNEDGLLSQLNLEDDRFHQLIPILRYEDHDNLSLIDPEKTPIKYAIKNNYAPNKDEKYHRSIQRKKLY